MDRVLELQRNERILAIKNVTFNEPYFMGHFPGRPVMPGVLILEALAQAAGLLAFDAMGQVPDENNIYYFVGIDGARFKRPVWSPVISCTWRSRSIACAPVSGSSRAWPRGRRSGLRSRADVHHACRGLMLTDREQYPRNRHR